MVKQWKPDAIVVFGGPHATALPDQVLTHYPQIDYIVRGEGERTIVDLAEKTKRSNRPFILPGKWLFIFTPAGC